MTQVKIPCHNRSHLFFSIKFFFNITIIIQHKKCSYIEAIYQKNLNSIKMFHNIRKCMFFVIIEACHYRSLFSLPLRVLFWYHFDIIKMGILRFLGSLNPNVIREFQNSKWWICYSESRSWKLLYIYKYEYLKVFSVTESKSDNRISKFKMANLIWQIKRLKIVVFL